VRYPKPTEASAARIVPPCGLCRELLIDHGGPGLQVVLDVAGVGRLMPAAELLVHKYVGTKWPTTSADLT
jgi:cytidine deaminase